MDKILFFLLFLLPFVIFPFGTSPFETPKVYVAEIGIIILILWFLSTSQARELLQKKYLPYYILFLLGVLQLFLVPSQTLFFGNAFRMSGVFLLWLLLLFSLLASRISLKIPSERVIVALLGLQVLAAIFIEGKIDARAVGTLGEANALAGFVVFLWPFLFLSEKPSDRARRFFQILGTALTLFIIGFSASRSGIVAFGIEAVFIALFTIFRLSLGKTVLISLLLFFASLTLPFFETDTIYENRSEIWQTALVAGYEHPLIGWGYGNTETALEEYNEKLYNRLRGYYIDSSHNLFLDFWVQGGFIGLASLVTLVYFAFRIYTREQKALYLCLLLGLLTVLSFNPMSIAILLQFWWVLGRSMK